jgi:hypothetical protein
VDPGRAPERIGEAHPADQITDFGIHLGPPDGLIAIASMSGSLCDATGSRLSLYQHHGVEHLRPNPVKPNTEKSVRGEEPNPTWVLPSQDAYLMPKANEYEFQRGAATKPEGENGNDVRQNRDHASDSRAPKSLNFLRS